MKRFTERLILCFLMTVLIIQIVACSGDNQKNDVMDDSETVHNALGIRNPSQYSWDYVSIGKYWYNDTNQDWEVNPKDKSEKIIWRVLSVEDRNKDGIEDTALLLTEQCLDAMQFDVPKGRASFEEADWESSTLRKWLNNAFYNAAFNDKEKSAIVETDISTEKYNGDIAETKDKLFLLSFEDIQNERYGFKSFTEEEIEKGEIKSSAWEVEEFMVFIGDIGEESGDITWWLRSPSKAQEGHELVVSGDCVSRDGSDCAAHLWVRPAMYVSLDNAEVLPKVSSSDIKRR